MQNATIPDSQRVYVKVNADFMEDGTIYPREIFWEDRKVYEIDLVLDIRRISPEKAPVQDDRYIVTINHRKKCLYFERDLLMQKNNLGRWFVERKQKQPGNGRKN